MLCLATALDILLINSYWVRYRTSVLHQGFLLSLDSYMSSSDVAYSCISGPGLPCIVRHSLLPLPPSPDCSRHSLPLLDGFALVLWLESAFHYALGVEYGKPKLNYSWPLLVLVVKVVGLMCGWLSRRQTLCDL